MQVLEDPSLPTEPSSPRRKLAVAAGVAAMIFLLIDLTLGWTRRSLIDRLLKDGGDTPGASRPPRGLLVPAE